MKELSMQETENINGGYYTINSEPPCGTGGDPWLAHAAGHIIGEIGNGLEGGMKSKIYGKILGGLTDL
ncbi:hypothetical protein [Clostridium thermobutyricum]|uniref:hypothetical protein n=1 Tax=Clostridium thermobutyricum TaxID=29372 RepID=UPI0018AA7F6D|nr:hypothetical protein [Clostridium thermobutyricum]